MPKSNCIELPTGETIPILYEDRSVLAIDKPRGWMLVPFSWQKTSRNLQAALVSSIAARDFWARSRNLKFLRFVHRLDADTSGILLFAKSQGALDAYGDLFESRRMEKVYLAVVHGTPKQKEWTCRLKLGPDPRQRGRMMVDPRHGKEAETSFRVIESRACSGARTAESAKSHPNQPAVKAVRAPEPHGSQHQKTPFSKSAIRNPKSPIDQSLLTSAPTFTLIEACPFTGRTHQIRVHAAESGCPIVGDDLYTTRFGDTGLNLGLRAISLSYNDPFTRRRINIEASPEEFCREFGFSAAHLRSAGSDSNRP